MIDATDRKIAKLEDKNAKMKEALDEIREWIKNDGIINDVYFDSASISARITELIGS